MACASSDENKIADISKANVSQVEGSSLDQNSSSHANLMATSKIGSAPDLPLADLTKIRNAHEKRFLVVRDILNSHTEKNDELLEFCNDAHRWMSEVDRVLRQYGVLAPNVAPPIAPCRSDRAKAAGENAAAAQSREKDATGNQGGSTRHSEHYGNAKDFNPQRGRYDSSKEKYQANPLYTLIRANEGNHGNYPGNYPGGSRNYGPNWNYGYEGEGVYYPRYSGDNYYMYYGGAQHPQAHGGKGMNFSNRRGARNSARSGGARAGNTSKRETNAAKRADQAAEVKKETPETTTAEANASQASPPKPEETEKVR